MRSAKRKATRKATTKRPAVRKGAKAWSSAEAATLRQAYRTKSATAIAKMLRRSVSSVKAKARILKLRKPASWRAAGRKATRKTTAKRKATRKATVRRRR